MRVKLTTEQEESVECIKGRTPSLKINAFAGSGKTSTLAAIAEACPDLKFAYLAFNKGIALEARKRFPKNVSVNTTHGLAYKYTKDKFDMSAVRGQFKAAEIKDILGLKTWDESDMVNKVFVGFCQSGRELDENIVGRIIRSNPALSISHRQSGKTFGQITESVSEIAKRMESRELPVTHDYYLKYFQLNIGDYPAASDIDYVLLDEAQDTNDVVLSMTNRFPRRVIVGDRHQQIYAFRGSINAMDSFPAEKETRLSSSFRITARTAESASSILSSFKGETVKIKGLSSELADGGKCFITRTNSGLIRLMDAHKDERWTTVRKPDEIFRTPLSIYSMLSYFKNKDRSVFLSVQDKYLSKFQTREELKDYASETGDIELLSAIDLANMFGGKLVELKNLAVEKYADKNAPLVFSTAHAAKGLEWTDVTIMDDFDDLLEYMVKEGITRMNILRRMIKNNDPDALNVAQEVNLFYVAMTRAKRNLHILSSNAAYTRQNDGILNHLLIEKEKEILVKKGARVEA